MRGIIDNEIFILDNILNKNMDYKTQDIIRILVKYYFNNCNNELREDKMNDDFVYNKVVEVLKNNIGNGFNINYWDKRIRDTIGYIRGRNSNLANIKEIPITIYEWNVVCTINNNILRKIMFTLIVYRKMIMSVNELSKGNVRIPLTYIFQESKVGHKGVQQKLDIHELISLGLVRQNKSCDDTSIILNIYENGDDSDIKFEITDFENIYSYYDEFYNSIKYKNCDRCKKRIKITNNKVKYCFDCSKISKNDSNKRLKNY